MISRGELLTAHHRLLAKKLINSSTTVGCLHAAQYRSSNSSAHPRVLTKNSWLTLQDIEDVLDYLILPKHGRCVRLPTFRSSYNHKQMGEYWNQVCSLLYNNLTSKSSAAKFLWLVHISDVWYIGKMYFDDVFNTSLQYISLTDDCNVPLLKKNMNSMKLAIAHTFSTFNPSLPTITTLFEQHLTCPMLILYSSSVDKDKIPLLCIWMIDKIAGWTLEETSLKGLNRLQIPELDTSMYVVYSPS